ncbi:hypothetical protein MNBD_GAMMA24-519 [hydrothermal vent metagenome]|uniref:Uncharacterized protein n=1 Tax=hydrothermal vent metagenome TaxID=652676 RepID=A0A3B1BJ55_9ZZZZ
MTGKPNNRSADFRSFIKTVSSAAKAAPERFQDKWARLSISKTRPNKDLEPDFGSTKIKEALKRHSDASGPGCNRIPVWHIITQQMDKRNEHIRVDMHRCKQERI